MKCLIAVPLLVAAVLAGATAHATEPSGFEANVSLGYAAPSGTITPDNFGGGSEVRPYRVLPTNLNQWFSSAVPLRLAVGWRRPHLFVGAAFQYAWTVPATSPGSACAPPAHCNGLGSDVTFGPSVDFHLLPEGTIDPWIGAQIGLETTSFDGVFRQNDGSLAAGNVWALSWIATWQTGIDVKLADHLRGGPFVGFSLGSAGGADGNHEWIFGGLRLVFDSAEKTGLGF